MRKLHSKVISKFLATRNISTAKFSVRNIIRNGHVYSVLYSYALPVAIKKTNSGFGEFFIGNYIREISVTTTTTAQIRAVVLTLNGLGLKYEMMSIGDFEKFVTEII